MSLDSPSSLKLTIELVPSSSFYNNVRSNVTTAEWDKLRKASYAKANHVCEICGDVGQNQGVRHAVECHEIWDYNDTTKVQKLTGLISLCPNCHRVKHAGKAQLDGKMEVVIDQLMRVNNMTDEQALDYIVQSFMRWKMRSNHKWTLDISYLENIMQKE